VKDSEGEVSLEQVKTVEEVNVGREGRVKVGLFRAVST